MRLQEYLTEVTEQMRCQQAREMVSEELRDHILDQARAYEDEGMFEEEALEKAVQDMGDPVETGVALDGIHRPQVSVGLLLLIGVMSLLSIAVHGILGAYTQDVAGAGYGYLHRHVTYLLLGYVLMLLIYRLDYTILARHAKKIALVFLAVFFAGSYFFGIQILGASLYIRLGPFYLFVPMLMSLYVPVYGGLLYVYRGEGYKAFIKLILWAVVPVWYVFRIPSLSQAMVLWCTLLLLLGMAVYKGWYAVKKKKMLVLTGILFTAPVWLMSVYVLLGGATYQVKRIHAFLTNSPDYNYQAIQMRGFLADSQLIGGNAEQITEIGKMPGFNNDYIFVSLISAYGILAGILLVVLFAFLLIKIFRVSFGQKNQLGLIVGCGCGILYLFQIGISIGMNLGLLPTTSVTLPLFSSGGSGIVVSYILLGLVLSIHRYQKILPDKISVGKTFSFHLSLKL